MRDNQVRIHLGSTIAAAGAVCVACVEGFFYSRIIPNRTDTVTIPLINYTIPQTDIFFIWGFLLVMTLFGLGMICYQNGARVLHGTALTSLRKQLRAFKKETVQWSATMQHAEQLASAANAAVVTGQTAARSETVGTAAVAQRLLEIRTLLETPDEVGVNEQLLGATDVRQIAVQALLWLFLATFATVLAIYVGAASFVSLAPGTDNPLVLALGQAALVSIVGFLLGWGETIVQGRQWLKVTAPALGRVIGIGLASLFALSYLVLIVRAFTTDSVLLWTVNLLVALAVAASCYQLTPLLGFEAIWARKFWNLLVAIGEWAYRSLIGGLLAIAIFLDGIFTILAGPIIVFKRRSTALIPPKSFANEPD